MMWNILTAQIREKNLVIARMLEGQKGCTGKQEEQMTYYIYRSGQP